MANGRKPYTDVFGKPLKQEDVALGVRATVQSKTITPMQMHRLTRLGVGRSANILRLLQNAGVVSAKAEDGKRTVILRSEPMAINAALRTLRKGNK